MGEDVIGVEANKENEKEDKEPGDDKDKKESLQVTRERVCTPLYLSFES